ncbi:MAG: MATE family efflux transporter [Candidatus Cloacimonetes bacterium]|nr:MATE family efflux transporter [Candidatus Cloacimonadota bacterium]
MLQDPPYKVFLKYALPSIFGLLSISSASIIDGYFVGNYVGPTGLAAINLCSPIFAILLGFSLMFAVSHSLLISKMIGENNVTEARNIFTKSLVLTCIFSFSLSALVYFNISNIFGFFSIKGELNTWAHQYLSILLMFVPYFMIGVVIDYFVRADESPILSFLALFLSSAINIGLDYLFIVKYNYGISGAAYATGASQALIMVFLIPHFFHSKSRLRLMKPIGSFFNVIVALKNGISELINECSGGVIVMIFNYIMLKDSGAEGVAAYTIVSYFILINLMLSFAISDGLQPILAQHLGAKKQDRITSFLKLGFTTILGFSLLLIISVLLYSEPLTNLFIDESQTLATKDIAIDFLKYTWCAFIFSGNNILITSYLTSMQKAFQSGLISLLRGLVLPLVLVISLYNTMGIIGVYITLPISEFLTFLVAFSFFKKSQSRVYTDLPSSSCNQ